MRDNDQEKRVELYHSAMLELEHAFMAGRLVDARAEIMMRGEKLRDMPGLHNEERRAIDDALRNLRVLEQEDVQREGEEQRKAAQRAIQQLGKLRSVIQPPTQSEQSREG